MKLSLSLLALLLTFLLAADENAVSNGTMRRTVPASPPPITGQVRLSLLDERNIVLSGYYQDFLRERFAAECGDFLKTVESDPKRPQWSKNFHNSFAAVEVLEAYRPKIVEAWQNAQNFRLESDGSTLKIKKHGYWPNVTGTAKFPDYSGVGYERIINAGELVHHAYIELEEPLRPGQSYTLHGPFGEKTEFKYDGRNFSHALKVNQVGYSPAANRKYAYLGAWRGPELGALEISQFEGKDFFLIDAGNKEAFKGKVKMRPGDAKYIPKGATDGAPFTGEEVAELDFSSFNKPGNYRVYLPGVGASWPFSIGNDAIGEAFYVRMKGIYQKRCGIAKARPYTNWVDGACHMATYPGTFPPNNMHYNLKDPGGSFTGEDGKRVFLSQFELIGKTCKAGEALPGVSGGWHDAADYDRRPYHLEAAGDLIAAYLIRPENFSDGQLNIPESGNGIPDILDEAIWGLEVWRKAQNAKGGVGCWIEADSHPQNPHPSTDKQPYFLALPTMESSAQYASYAASLALALKKAGATEQAQLFLDSARRAYDYAKDPSNRVTADYDYNVTKGKEVTRRKLHYEEAAEAPGGHMGKAALGLYLLTGEQRFLKDLPKYKAAMLKDILELSWRSSAFHYVELATEKFDDPVASEIAEAYRKRVVGLADERLKELEENYQYRMPWHPTNHAFVTHMSWGNFHPLRRAAILVAAWRLTGDKKYRDGAYLCNDWQLGTNAYGASTTSGLGHNYPVRFLDLPSVSDGIEEYVWGITPYRIFPLEPSTAESGYGLFKKVRPDHKFAPVNMTFVPEAVFKKSDNPDFKEFRTAVSKAMPVLHRFANLESYTVATSEYTVSETLTPHAAVTGCLLEPGYMPSPELKDRRPAKSVTDLPGLWTLP